MSVSAGSPVTAEKRHAALRMATAFWLRIKRDSYYADSALAEVLVELHKAGVSEETIRAALDAGIREWEL